MPLRRAAHRVGRSGAAGQPGRRQRAGRLARGQFGAERSCAPRSMLVPRRSVTGSMSWSERMIGEGVAASCRHLQRQPPCARDAAGCAGPASSHVRSVCSDATGSRLVPPADRRPARRGQPADPTGVGRWQRHRLAGRSDQRDRRGLGGVARRSAGARRVRRTQRVADFCRRRPRPAVARGAVNRLSAYWRRRISWLAAGRWSA